MDKNLIAKKLNRTVEIVTQSFDNNGIEVVSYGFCKINEETGWLEFLVEMNLPRPCGAAAPMDGVS